MIFDKFDYIIMSSDDEELFMDQTSEIPVALPVPPIPEPIKDDETYQEIQRDFAEVKINNEDFICMILSANSDFFEHDFSYSDWASLRQCSKKILACSQEGIMKQLLPHQHVHFREIRGKLRSYRRMVDTSMMGCGKTYTSCALAKNMGVPIIIFAPANTVTNWRQAAKHFGITDDRMRFFSYTEFQKKQKPFLRAIVKPEKPAFYIEQDMKMCPTKEW